MADLARARAQMVERQLKCRGIADPRVLAAMASVPREAFIAESQRDAAYVDGPLPIGDGQTISQPYVVAMMLQAALLQPDDLALEIGTGSGYAAAVMAEIVRQVHTIERHPRLAEIARARLELMKYRNVQVHLGDGSLGWPDAAPFDAIIAAAGGPVVPATLKGQLAIGGRLVMPVGPGGEQRLLKLTRQSETGFREEDLGAVWFVPLIGAEGWQASTTAGMEPDPSG
ncbi:MAG TPA: protein-L-isoaspartate(D-aspartate) O-methyltransferase [Geminicoccus sp.]|uniref:protein-L-isoaspartate(D-aspartate) O-methyltransferase n=1 Tax=Geminicoccus sp. TaxID=2024832 RepID=UPI002B9DA2A9|nr:protein-L-isoaspartate(D-aspartate) O-methyltransferase [Geminicoccus sp.]HWL71657.1 protein-L-isoaspartate(D-aspartate) O-methyltransferase [Geminicoccus sp.]